nr:MAG TPA: hypothetical protein [Caudoviricetes sp.]
MIKIYEVRIVKDDRTHFHQCFFDEKLAEFEARQQNDRATKDNDAPFFFVKPHVVKDSYGKELRSV